MLHHGQKKRRSRAAVKLLPPLGRERDRVVVDTALAVVEAVDLVRARQRIRDLALPFAVPDTSELSSRLDGVLHTLYLLFNEGYKASVGNRLVREELLREARAGERHLA